MTKFLVRASYTHDGVKGILKAGGTNRREAVNKMINDLGGKLEAFYFAFGEHDVYAIGEMPDTKSVAAMSLAINSTGLVSVSVTILLSPEEVDKAANMSVNYRKPGS
jgi:uncharacterized protein with GYD domain